MTNFAIHNNSRWGTLPTSWGSEICTYLDHSSITVPLVCKTWYRFLDARHFTTNGHLDQSSFSRLEDDQFAQCISFMRNKQTTKWPIRSITLDLRKVFDLNKAADILTSLQHLEKIDFGSGQKLTSLVFLTKLSAVKSFKITSTALSDSDLDYLKHLPLEVLECAKWNITQISALITLPLKDLRLIQCLRLNATALDMLEQLPLDSLSLCGNIINRLPSLNAKSLRTLDISSTRRLDPSCLQTIAQLTSLTALNLANCPWLNNLAPLQKNTSLITLNLSATGIRNPHLKDLSTQLINLDLSKCLLITDVSGLQHLTNLHYLNAKDLYRVNNFRLIERPSLKIEHDEKESQQSAPPPRLERTVMFHSRRRLF